jgi:isoleucyl-tRNA synthetase
MEAHDQTRGWFWSQLGMGTAALGEVPYEQVVMHGHALDEDGRKMSKSLGNIVEPGEAIERHGRDPMRLFLLSVTPQADDMKFSWDEMAEMQRRLNILWNVFRFPLPYMRMDDFDPDTVDRRNAETELVDEWVLSRLQTVTDEMSGHLDAFEQHKALDALVDFVVEDVSRFYLQVVRERMWEKADSPSKDAAYATLYHVLESTTALFAPFAPFVAEEMYQQLTGDTGFDTVHMCDWPDPDEFWLDEGLEADVEAVRAAEEAGSNARQQAEHSLRWPVTQVTIDVTEGEDLAAALENRTDIIAERLNARTVDVLGLDDGYGEIEYAAEADMSLLGPEFGDDAGRVMNALNETRVSERSIAALETAVEDETGMAVDLDDEMVEFVRHTPETISSTVFDALDGIGVVYVDTALTADIESEGYARDAIRRIQEMRKELDLDIDERIRVALSIDDERVAALVWEHEDLIAEEVRADEFGTVEDGHRKEWEVQDVTMTITVEPLATAEASD